MARAEREAARERARVERGHVASRGAAAGDVARLNLAPGEAGRLLSLLAGAFGVARVGRP